MIRARSPSVERIVPLALIALALFLRILVPAGWMPADDGLGIRPCAQAVAETAAPAAAAAHHGAAHQDETGQDDKQQAQPCSFTALAFALDLSPPAGTLSPALLPETDRPSDAPANAPIGQRLAAPPPPQTGPPVFA